MADSSIPITSGAGTNIDTRTETTNLQHRQVVVLGDPAINDNVVNAVTADPGASSTTPGIVMRLAGSASVQVVGASGSIGVFFDRSNPNVTANAGTGSFTVQFDPGHELGTIRGNTNTLTVFLPDTGHELGSIRGINSTVSVAFSPSGPLVLANTSATTVVANAGSTVSGSTSGISVSGVQLVAPEAGHNTKIYAFSITTTAVVPIVPKFTNGAGTGPTEFWRVALQAISGGMAGANLAVTPPAYLFATGVNVTLAVVLDSASLIHYSVAYFKESA